MEFNANRVFDPRSLIRLAEDNGLVLSRLIVIRDGGDVQHANKGGDVMRALAHDDYNLGIFTFIKPI